MKLLSEGRSTRETTCLSRRKAKETRMNSKRDMAQQRPSSYFIDQELIEEMVRLNRQGRLLTEGMGGVLPEQQELSHIHDILDLACGPGEWVMRVAQEYPDKRVVGVDLSQRMIEYASVQAEAEDINATFQVMDITHPLAFPDASFDLLNMRLLAGFMKKEMWRPLLCECFRVLRPGGIVRVTESEVILTNSPVLETYTTWGIQAYQKAGQAFSFEGQKHIGVALAMKQLLTQAGFVTPCHSAHAVDFSTATAAHEGILEDLMLAFKLVSPFLSRLGIATREQVRELREQMRELIGKEEFSSYWFLVTVWAHRPA